MFLRIRCQRVVRDLVDKKYYSSNDGGAAGASSSNVINVGRTLLDCYKVLNLAQDCNKEQLKNRYLELAKKFHPDSDKQTADANKFREVYNAYKYIVDHDYSNTDRQELQELSKIYDIRHTAPQHRLYLEYAGVGHGTPSQRQRQYQQHRVQQASEHVNEYMVQKLQQNEDDLSLVSKTKQEAEYAKKWKTRGAIDRLVEDLIQESMKKGEFDKLRGYGKPLPHDNYNPFVDDMTHKVNQILIQNGFCPEWAVLEKEIRSEISRIRQCLKDERQRLTNDWRLENHERDVLWQELLDRLAEDRDAINKRIDDYNLLVPLIHKQMVHFDLKRETDRLLQQRNKERSIDESNPSNEIDRKVTADEQRLSGEPRTGAFRKLLNAFFQAKTLS